VAGIPSLLPAVFDSSVSFFGIILLAIIVLVAVSSIVFFQEAQRRIPVQYSRTQFRGGRQYRQQGSTHIPLRLLSAGMIPIIFAYSIMLFPPSSETLATSTGLAGTPAGFLRTPSYRRAFLSHRRLSSSWDSPTSTLVTFQQQNLAENLQKKEASYPASGPATTGSTSSGLSVASPGGCSVPGDCRDAVLRDRAHRCRR
jgi:preprotein translocase subunit SecY